MRNDERRLEIVRKSWKDFYVCVVQVSLSERKNKKQEKEAILFFVFVLCKLVNRIKK